MNDYKETASCVQVVTGWKPVSRSPQTDTGLVADLLMIVITGIVPCCNVVWLVRCGSGTQFYVSLCLDVCQGKREANETQLGCKQRMMESITSTSLSNVQKQRIKSASTSQKTSSVGTKYSTSTLNLSNASTATIEGQISILSASVKLRNKGVNVAVIEAD